MKWILPKVLEAGRITEGEYGSKNNTGPFGAFLVFHPAGQELRIIANGATEDSEGWEHVSVSCRLRCPDWNEMCFVKDLFWRPEECVIQYHPPKREYINHHPFCLHLWKPPFKIQTPPSILIGPK